MDYKFNPLGETDRTAVIDIFNYFVENTFASYWEEKVGYELFDRFLLMTSSYPAITVKTSSGETIGFAFLRAFHPADSFHHTAEITYFILPDHTGRGLGSQILDYLTEKAVNRGIKYLLASISSLNDQSISFHKKHGFVECGRFKKIGHKKGSDFDVVWMQKELT